MARDDRFEDPDGPEEESQDEEYDENADEDFNPDKPNGEEEASSSEDDDEQEKSIQPTKQPRKRKAEDIGDDLDSGDEATIRERKSKKRKKATTQDEDSGGEGGFIRTRAQRVVEKEERKNRKRARDGEVTINVDEIWAQLNSIPIGRTSIISVPQPETDRMDVDQEQNKENAPEPSAKDLITIMRSIDYAGEISRVEVQVPRTSKEAQRYLKEHPEADPEHRMHGVQTSELKKPLKRPSMFEPNPIGLVKGVAPEKLRLRAPTRMDVLMAQKRAEEKRNAQKMSTVQKSALDWKGFVDQEGLKDELDEYGKSKRGYLAREAFLDRAAGAREQAARDARLKL